MSDQWKLNLFLKTKVDKDYPNPSFPMNRFKRKVNLEGSPQLILKRSRMKNKFIKEVNEVDMYNKADYYYKKASRNKSKTATTNDLLFKILQSVTTEQAKGNFHDEKERVQYELQQEKLFLKGKVANFYHEIENQQREVRREKASLELEEDNRQKQAKENKQLFDIDLGVNKLIKDSILETYDLVRNNKRASTIKIYVCSATNYLKKNKRI